MHLIYKNAFKRCINTCTFHDNLLFYICSVDGPIRFWNFLLVRVFSHSQTQWKVQSIALKFGTTLACVFLCLIILTFLASLLLKLRSQGQCFFGNEYLAKIFSKVCAFTQGKDSRCQSQHIVSVESSSLFHHGIYLWFICFPWWTIDELENLHADRTTNYMVWAIAEADGDVGIP